MADEKGPPNQVGLSIAVTGGPGATRTPDPQIRSLMLYPAELRDRTEELLILLCFHQFAILPTVT